MSLINVGNLGGVLYKENTPLCSFKFIDDRLVQDKIVIYDWDPFNLPLPMVDYYDDVRWHMFWDSQCIPRTRHRLMEDLQRAGVFTDYVPEQILRYTKGRNWANSYWIKCDDDISCWAEWQIRVLGL